METVLVVDDDRLLRETLLELVSDCGYQGLEATDGQMLFSSFHHIRFNLWLVTLTCLI